MGSQATLELPQVQPRGTLSIDEDSLTVATEDGTADINLQQIVRFQKTHKEFPLQKLGQATLLLMGITAVVFLLQFPMELLLGLTAIVGLGMVFATLYLYQSYGAITELTIYTENEEFTVTINQSDAPDFDKELTKQMVATENEEN